MPNLGLTTTVTVENNEWVGIGQVIYIQVGGAKGTFEVISKTSAPSPTLEIKNLNDGTFYIENSPFGTSFAVGANVSPSGRQGPSGASVSGAPAAAPYITQTPVAGLTSEVALSTLATGLMKVTTGTGGLSTAVDDSDYLSPSTGLRPASIGVSVQAFDAGLQSLSAFPTVADRYVYSTGANVWVEAEITPFSRAMLAEHSGSDWRTNLGVNAGYGLLGTATINLSVAANDTSLTIQGAQYLIDKVTLENPSVPFATASLGLFSLPGGGGTTLCATQTLTALTAPEKIMHMAKQPVVDTDRRTETQLYARTGVAQAMTVIMRIYGWRYT